MQLRPSDIAFDPASYVDPNGRLFRWNGGLYRGIAPHIAGAYRTLIESPAMGRLVERGLIDTQIAPLEVEGFGLVLRHREIGVRSYPFEWPAAMLRDAALLTLDLLDQLAPLGFDLQDASPYNVLFDGPRPVFVDFGSITPANPNAPMRAVADFVQCFVNPLYLITGGHPAIARELMRDPTRWGVRKRDVRRAGRRVSLHHWWHVARRLPNRSTPRAEAIASLRALLAPMRLPATTTEWSGYYDEIESLDAPHTWSLKQQTAAQVLDRFRPKSVLDVGSNAGWFSKLAARTGARVVALDRDEAAINALYAELVASGSRAADVLPLIQDFAQPSSAHGPNAVFPDAFARFRADFVLCLALTHHLARAGLRFEQMADTLDRFTGERLLVEFVPADDKYVAEWITPSHDWYTLDNFRAAFETRFDRVTVLPSNRPPRVLLLCERSAQASTVERLAA